MKKLSYTLITLTTTLLVFVTCQRQTEITSLTVKWKIGLSMPSTETCQRAGISNVLVELDPGTEVIKKEENCYTGEASFSEIPRVGYRVYISGLDSKGCVVYYTEGEVKPDSDSISQSFMLEWVPSSGNISIDWWFEDGRFCSYHQSPSVRVMIFKDDVKIVDEEVDCDKGNYTMRGAQPARYSIRIETSTSEGLFCVEYHDLNLEPCGGIEISEPLTACQM